MTFRFVTLTTFPRPYTKQRRQSQFDSSYDATISLLVSELSKLGAKDPVIQIALRSDQIRRDGLPRAGARPDHPGVAVTFDSRHGPMSYACDEFLHWLDNLRGIAKTLERLRQVDMYGVTKSGEQYRGWAALPPGEPSPNPAAPLWDAASRIAAATGGEYNASSILNDAGTRRKAYRAGARKLHPDAGGSHSAFLLLAADFDLLESQSK